MSLVDVESDSDPWLREHELCLRLYREILEQLNSRNGYPKNSESYSSISGAIRIRMKQYSTEVQGLKTKLDHSHALTFEEKERRQRMVEMLESKNIQLLQRLNERGTSTSDRNQLFGRGASSWPIDDDDISRPLLMNERELTVEELKQQQKKMIAEQDRGLENLSSVISRQKEISIMIGNEVDLQTDLVDNIADRMDRTNTSIQREITHVKVVSTKDKTCGYWIVIILLFIAILVVAIIH